MGHTDAVLDLSWNSTIRLVHGPTGIIQYTVKIDLTKHFLDIRFSSVQSGMPFTEVLNTINLILKTLNMVWFREQF